MVWWIADAVARPTEADLTAAWEAVRPSVEAKSAFPLAFEPGDFATLVGGDTIARRVFVGDDAFAFGAVLVPASLEATWVAIQDTPHWPPDALRIDWLNDSSLHRRSYMYLDLPMILTDRQWVTEYAPNADLAVATGDRVWQRVWTTGDPSAAPAPDPDAMWVDNQGTWTLIVVGDHTLALFSVHAALGGSIPEGISTRFTVSTLHSSMRTVVDRAGTMVTHYDAAHFEVQRPDGTVIAPLTR